MDYIEKKHYNDNSLFFLIILCFLIFSIFSSVLINKNAKIINYISDVFYSNYSNSLPIINNPNSNIQNEIKYNQIEYNEFKSGVINDVFIKGKLQECLDQLIINNKISENDISKLLKSINNLYEIDNVLNLNTEINLIKNEDQSFLQDIKIKLDNFRYLKINNINNNLIIKKIFDAEGVQNQLNDNLITQDLSLNLNSINEKKIFELRKNYILSIKKISIDKNTPLLKNIPEKSLINFIDKKNKTVKLITLAKKNDNGKNSILYFSLEKNNKSLKYYLHSDGKYYLKNGQSISQENLLSMPLSNGYRISSSFGYRIHPILRYKKMHTGVDLAIQYGTPIKAAGSGKIEFVGKKSGYGRYILINHGGGYKTGYAHMSSFAQNLKVGGNVTRGQLIGKVGTSGLSSGPHLHYELIKNGKFTNPLTSNLKLPQNINKKDYRKFSSEVKNIEYIINQLKQIESKKAQII
jgi:murein DD-endopeptidase MepM/ murein hydrolase activator NlpD